MASFFETVTAAVNDITERGYESEAQLEYWVNEIREAAYRDMTPERVLDQHLRQVLMAAYMKSVEKGGILARHPGVQRFTLEQVKPRLRAELDRRILASAQLIKLNRDQVINETLRRFQGWATSIPPGGAAQPQRRAVKANVKKALAGLPFLERRVLVDQGHKLIAAVSDIIAADQNAIAAEWHSHWRQAGYDYRVEHRERDRVVYATKGSWAIQRRLISAGEQGYYEDHERPGEFVYCLPGDARIPFADGVEVAYRRWYSGELTEVITNSGKTLPATPNHPVLTPQGWRPIHLLQEGDEVIEVADQIVDLTKPRQHDAIPSIAEIFGTLHELGVHERRPGAREQFHGDGSEGDIDIIRADRSLSFSVNPDLSQAIEQYCLTVTSNARLAVRPPYAFDIADLTAAPSIVRSARELLPTIDAFTRHTDDIGFAGSAQHHADAFEGVGEIPARHIEALGERQHALAGLIRTARIVKIKRRNFSGHVFNLQTATDVYVAQGIITHNCRCYVRWIYNLRDMPKDMLTERGKKALEEARAKARAA